MYVGDCASTYRNNMFRDYEKHPYGTFEGNGQQPQQQRKSYYTMVQGKFNERHSFYFQQQSQFQLFSCCLTRAFVIHTIKFRLAQHPTQSLCP